jgi:Domain of unknown function (DUF1995)
MVALPRTLDESLEQMAQSVALGVERQKFRSQVEFRTPGLDVVQVIVPLVAVLPEPTLVLFPDAGAAALAQKRLGELEGISFRGLGSLAVQPADFQSFVLVQTSGVEIDRAEKLAQQCTDRPFVMVNPQLDAGVVGIGLAGRQLKTRFLNTIEMLYFLEPIDGGAVRRAYPGNWEIWREDAEDYILVGEQGQRPTLEDINNAVVQKGAGFFGELDKLIRALGR